MKKVKIIIAAITVSCLFVLVGCSNDKGVNTNNSNTKEIKAEYTNEAKDNNKETQIDILNPFNLKEKLISDNDVLLDNYNCRVQMHDLETCRLMLSSYLNKSETNFSFIGYAYEEYTNIPNAIFIDNTEEITNSNIYAVGLVGAPEGEKQLPANPIIASYKYCKTSNESAVITNNKNQSIGGVQKESAIEINKRISEIKEKLSL